MLKTIKTALLFIFAFSLFSCADDFLETTTSPDCTSSTDGNSYLVVDIDSFSTGRTILPSSVTTYKSKLTNVTLKGKLSDSPDESVQLAHSDTYAKFSGNIPIAAGTWELTLTAELDGVDFSANTTKTIVEGSINYLSFTLTTAVTYGGLSITMNFTGSADKVEATLQKENKENVASNPVTEITGTDLGQTSFTYTRSISNESERLAGGTYYIIFKFYKNDIYLNSYRSYVRIANGITTTATLSMTLNEVYSITYNDNGGTLVSGEVKTESYSPKSEVTLPQMERDGFTFGGWFESSDFSGTALTSLAKRSSGDKTLYAQFISDTVFVGGTNANDENDGLTSDAPLATVSSAVGRIESFGNREAAYTIKVSGAVTGAQTIPSTLTTQMASSLTIEGVTGQSGEVWIDVLDGDFSASKRGTTLTVDTAVPVTIKNLKITGGYNNDAGGIFMYAGSALTMESGEISGNTGSENAGGVYLQHGSADWNFSTSSYTTIVPGAVFTMNGGSICNNSGDGITLYDGRAPGTFTMNGGTITGNDGYGVNMVYSTSPFGTFTMKGDAVITSDNKVFLGMPGATKITIAGELTGTAPVATIKLNRYTANDQIIELADGVTDTTLAAAVTKFTIVQNGSVNWTIDADGKLQEAAPDITASMIVENAADINFSFTCDTDAITKGTSTLVTVTPAVTYTTTPLYYSEGKVYSDKSYSKLVSDESVAWNLTLWSEDQQITNESYVSTSGNTITLNIPYPGTYVIKATATYLGFAHDAEFSITCSE